MKNIIKYRLPLFLLSCCIILTSCGQLNKKNMTTEVGKEKLEEKMVVNVFAAASLTETLNEAKKSFEKNNPGL